MYILADCNSFYASCEQLFRPALRGKPVVVLSNNDGCVIARSAEAKAIGIKMGAPAFQMQYLVKEHDVAVFSSNFELYGDISRRVMSTLAKFSPDMEIYSIDEAFLQVDDTLAPDLIAYGRAIRKTVLRHTGIAVGVGIAPTKTLAKAANWYAKRRGNGVCAVSTPEHITALLKAVPIDEVWGVGRKYFKKLRCWGVQTAYDFVTKIPEHRVQEWMTIVGVRTWRELQGIPCISLEQNPPPKQSIATTRTFGRMVSSLAGLEEAVASFAESCAGKLRKDGLAAQRLMLFITTNFFREDLPQYSCNKVVQLPVPTADAVELVRYAKQALRQIFKEDHEYKKAGVVVSGLVPDTAVQTSFLDTVDREKSAALMDALDTVTGRFGRKSLHLAASGVQSKKSKWHMNQTKLSPRYTTRWEDIMVVKV